jgi:hypothetical protein
MEEQLREQKQRIYEAILHAETPEPTTWASKVLWSQARIYFAKIVLEVPDETDKIIIAE